MYSMSDTTAKTTGRVKWFNKNSGYGFVTAVDGDHSGEDIFVHHSALNVSKDQFRYLVEGEYISFLWSDSGKDIEEHKWHATSVTGVCSGPLMCETQNESRLNAVENSKKDQVDGTDDNSSSSRPQRRYRGGGPRISDGENYRVVRNRGSSHGRNSATASMSESM